MKIVIPTYRRAFQKTFTNLPQNIRDMVVFVRQEGDNSALVYDKQIILPPHIRDIASTRDFIIDWAYPDYVVMLDDDLEFAGRIEHSTQLLRKAYYEEIVDFFQWAQDMLFDYPHIGMSPREGANRNVADTIFVGRAMRVLGYDSKVIKDYGIKFAPYTFMCDFGVTLELLTRGHANVIYNKIVNNQSGSNNVPGGCTEQRTPELQRAAAEYLASRFPDFVDVVQKKTKTSWKGGERYDVRVQWRRAYTFGQSAHAAVLDGRAGKGTGTQGEGATQAVVK